MSNFFFFELFFFCRVDIICPDLIVEDLVPSIKKHQLIMQEDLGQVKYKIYFYFHYNPYFK